MIMFHSSRVVTMKIVRKALMILSNYVMPNLKVAEFRSTQRFGLLNLYGDPS
jgi:hypothetical protein